jgi:hypothetical protein
MVAIAGADDEEDATRFLEQIVMLGHVGHGELGDRLHLGTLARLRQDGVGVAVEGVSLAQSRHQEQEDYR